MRYPAGIILGIAALTLCQSPLAQAETSSDESSSSAKISTSFSVKQVEQADIDGHDASMGYTEIAAGIEWQFIFIDLDHRTYDWGEHTFLGTAEPFSELTQLALGLQYYQEFENGWSIWAKGTALIGFEDSPSTAAITYNPQVVTLYTVTTQLSLYCGAGVLYHPVDTTIYPVVGLAWNMKNKLGLFGTLGFPETALSYGFTEQLSLKLDVLWDNRIYQLAGDNATVADGYIKIEDMLPGIHVEYKPLNDLLLSIGVRRYFERKLTFFNQEEEEMGEYGVNDSWAYMFRAEYTF